MLLFSKVLFFSRKKRVPYLLLVNLEGCKKKREIKGLQQLNYTVWSTFTGYE